MLVLVSGDPQSDRKARPASSFLHLTSDFGEGVGETFPVDPFIQNCRMCDGSAHVCGTVSSGLGRILQTHQRTAGTDEFTSKPDLHLD